MALLTGGLLVAAAAGWFSRLEMPAQFPSMMGATALGTAGWLLGVYGALRSRSVSWILGVAIVARLAVLAAPEPLSDDLYRYLWDGRVGAAGINPFQHAPMDPALSDLRDEVVWPQINHPEISTIYPATAQWFFRVVDAVLPTQLGIRAGIVFADLAILGLLAWRMRRSEESAVRLTLFAWCPLVLLEGAAGGHIDTLGTLLLTASFLAFSSGRPAWVVGLLWGLSMQVKPVGLFVAPALLVFGGRRIVPIVLLALATLAISIPLWSAGARLFTGFGAYATHWQFNDAFYSWIVMLGASPRGARLVLGAALLLVATLSALRAERFQSAAASAIFAMIVLSPTVHPWYAVWMVPFVVDLSKPARIAAITCLALLPISYFTPWREAVTGEWNEPVWTRLVLWGGVLSAAVFASWRRRASD